MANTWYSKQAPVGVGLRHAHYHKALTTPAELDFVEVHSENFFALGGASLEILEDAAKLYPMSLHGTSLGLGSTTGISEKHLDALESLVQRVSPVMISDHAAFAWGEVSGRLVHGGDLLPIAFNQKSLQTLADNVNRVQDRLQRQISVENLSAYLEPEGSLWKETDFLNGLTELTQCRLLVDLNNVAVNAINDGQTDITKVITEWVDEINPAAVGEIHLAGCTPAAPGDIVVDDHSQKVSDPVWQAYSHALKQFGPVPTLIEWDTDLPAWSVLLAEAEKAKIIARQVSYEARETI
ncbi:DUF692 domain-containing protein [Endozoicomonas gorgoniicola]|uniref:DUF692 domain-containing protein n=1 Tax=Endozoicomonas gorgoniicola TaxID=1234144 RepID=A0ABT3MU67_9GAMM|nr:DUF692 domain-containing protein [Endozoicomonas gorgoniicola]MCW7552926.1 DUF692 domain-containing protein [Endozoicomonas gorgoniicola]